MKKARNKYIFGAAAMVLLLSVATTAIASVETNAIPAPNPDVKIFVNGSPFQPTDANGALVSPLVYQNTTYLPVRAVAEALGQKVTWDGKTNSVQIDPKPVEKVTVSTAEAFVKAIGSNKKIVLEPGVYDLSDVDPVNNADGTVVWEQNYYMPAYYGLVIQNVTNLTIEGSRTGKTEFVVDSRFVQVLTFCSSRNVTVKNITAGHTPTDYQCDAGVLLFYDCQNIEVSKSEFYGCGSTGLDISHSSNVSCEDVDINHCSFMGISISDSNDIAVSNTKIHDLDAWYNVVCVNNSGDVTFTQCEMSNNRFASAFLDATASDVLFDTCQIWGNTMSTNLVAPSTAFLDAQGSVYYGEPGKIVLKNTAIHDNQCFFFTDLPDAVQLDNCSMENNSWD